MHHLCVTSLDAHWWGCCSILMCCLDRLLVECNQLVVDIDNEVAVVHNFLRDKYRLKFPELESLVRCCLGKPPGQSVSCDLFGDCQDQIKWMYWEVC